LETLNVLFERGLTDQGTSTGSWIESLVAKTLAFDKEVENESAFFFPSQEYTTSKKKERQREISSESKLGHPAALVRGRATVKLRGRSRGAYQHLTVHFFLLRNFGLLIR